MMWLWLVEKMRIPHEVALFEDVNELIEEIEDVEIVDDDDENSKDEIDFVRT